MQNSILVRVNEDLSGDELYERTRKEWKISADRLEEIKYAFSLYKGIIKEVYAITLWHPIGDRFGFKGEVADSELRDRYIGKDLSSLFKKGSANPIRYISFEEIDDTLAEKVTQEDFEDGSESIYGPQPFHYQIYAPSPAQAKSIRWEEDSDISDYRPVLAYLRADNGDDYVFLESIRDYEFEGFEAIEGDSSSEYILCFDCLDIFVDSVPDDFVEAIEDNGMMVEAEIRFENLKTGEVKEVETIEEMAFDLEEL